MKRILIAAAILAIPTLASAEGIEVFKSTCRATVTAPQTMAPPLDCTAFNCNLEDLKEYGVYIASTPAALMAAPPVAVVPATEPDPTIGRTASLDCNGLPAGQHYIQWDAVRVTGARSERTAIVPFVLKLSPPPTGAAPSAPSVPVVTGP